MHNKILLIEDDEPIRTLYTRQFELEGFVIEGVEKGNEGLDEAFKNKYDIILLDILLPNINGLEILKRLKENESTKSIPVILLSNLAQDDIIKQGLALGAVTYLVKSTYTPKQILEETKKYLPQY